MTKPFFPDKQVSSNELWQAAVNWVAANRKLVYQIAAPYSRHMAADSNDLIQEANISAFKALRVARAKKTPDKFTVFFHVIFKTNCIRQAAGIRTSHNDFRRLGKSDKRRKTVRPGKRRAMNRAFNTMTRRQREVCTWLLKQPVPVSTHDMARKFRISHRHARRLVNNSIRRINRIKK